MKTSQLSLDQAPPEDIPFRYLLTGPFFGVLAGVFLVVYGERLFITAWSLKTVALVHTMTLGWLALIMMGAFYQMVPVLVGGHVKGIFISRNNYFVLVAGIFSLVIGFNFWITTWLYLAVLLLSLGICLFIGQLSFTLFGIKAHKPVVYALRLSIISLAVTVTFGILMIGMMYGWWELGVDRVIFKNIHMVSGLIGWIGFLLFGVAFHVIPMFYLTEAFSEKIAKWILFLMVYGIIQLIAGFTFTLSFTLLLVCAIPVYLAVSLFIFIVTKLIYQRQRKLVDTTLRFWQLGLISLVLALVLLPFNSYRMDEVFSYLFATVFILGFAVAITNGMLYKIVPFLIWLHRFSALVGKVKTPTMKEIVPDSPARKQFYLFVLCLLILLFNSVYPNDIAIRISGVLWILSNAIIIFCLFKAISIKPPEAPPTVSEDDFAAMFANLPPVEPSK